MSDVKIFCFLYAECVELLSQSFLTQSSVPLSRQDFFVYWHLATCVGKLEVTVCWQNHREQL